MHDIIVPKAGLDGNVVEVISILVSIGQTVAADTPLCEVEGVKLTFEVVADVAGVVTEILVKEGDEVEAGVPIMRIKQA